MNKFIALAMCLSAAAAVGGCNNSKSPDAVANDVSKAQQKAAADVADAQRSAAKSANDAETKVDEKSKDLNTAEAKGAYDVAIAKTDGEHKVAIEKCNVLTGAEQKACKDQADAKRDLAVANAKAALAAQK